MATIATSTARKHVVRPATAEEIRRTIGVTQKDSRVVQRVLTRLGYLREAATSKGGRVEPSGKKARGVETPRSKKTKAK